MEDLRCMTLTDTQFLSTGDIFVDAQGNPLPPPAKGRTITVTYMDVSLAVSDHDMGMSPITAKVRLEGLVSRIMALPVRYGKETADDL